jgi:hypothetical protein
MAWHLKVATLPFLTGIWKVSSKELASAADLLEDRD